MSDEAGAHGDAEWRERELARIGDEGMFEVPGRRLRELRDAEATAKRYKVALQKIVDCDYRGNMPTEQAIAWAALAEIEAPDG